MLNSLGKDAILFVLDTNLKLIGSITDGDVRRGLLKGITIEKKINEILQPYPHFFRLGKTDIKKVIQLRESNFRIIPVLDEDDRVVKVINFRKNKSYLPIDAIIMAGGIGKRLMPLTKNKPKPLLHVGDKPIIEHNINRLNCFGIDNYWVSIKYLGDQIEQYFDKSDLNIHFVREKEPLGTIGAVSKINDLVHDYVLICNSDILTNLDYEHFFLDFLENDADMSIVSIPYKVNIPYAVLEIAGGKVNDLKEKPTYTYYSNGGIYLVKKKLLQLIPKNIRFDATDFIECLIQKGYNIISYPLTGYWLDIGSHEDFIKAQSDIKHISF
jgi:dTDP-glucose pyrophosphorylase